MSVTGLSEAIFHKARSANGGNGHYWLERDHPALL
jgi:hypothetical protein